MAEDLISPHPIPEHNPVQPNVPALFTREGPPLSRFGPRASSLSSSLPLMLGLILMVQHIQSGYGFQAAGAWRGGMSIFNPDQTCLTQDVKPAHWYCMGLLIKDNSWSCLYRNTWATLRQSDWDPRLKLSRELKLCQKHSVYFNHTHSHHPFIPACMSVALPAWWNKWKRLLFL